MFEFKIKTLKVDDEFTADNGWSWWKIRGIDGCDIDCECLSSENPAHKAGDRDSFWFLPDDTVVVR